MIINSLTIEAGITEESIVALVKQGEDCIEITEDQLELVIDGLRRAIKEGHAIVENAYKNGD